MSIAVTFYNNKIDDQIVQYQKKVFECENVSFICW